MADAAMVAGASGLVAIVACADRIAATLGASLHPDAGQSVLDPPAPGLLSLDDVKVAVLLTDVEDDLARLRQAH